MGDRGNSLTPALSRRERGEEPSPRPSPRGRGGNINGDAARVADRSSPIYYRMAMNDFAARLDRVHPSAIRTLNERARDLKAMGHDPIDLSIGEPDFETPENVKGAAIDAIRRGETRYTEIHGSRELRDAIGAKFKRDQGLEFPRDQITVAGGAKLIMFNAMMAEGGTRLQGCRS